MNTSKNDDAQKTSINLKKEIKQIAGWETDTISISYHKHNKILHPHTILLFVPGNPGCIGWYTPFLQSIIQNLGTGYAAHGVSYAGHGTGTNLHVKKNPETTHSLFINNKQRILHTIQGQIDHKIQWIDQTLFQYDVDQHRHHPNIIFLTHSIGAYLIQNLCIQRLDILHHTKKIIHLMPFYRFKPEHYIKEQLPLDTIAKFNKTSVEVLALISYIVSFVPKDVIMFFIHSILNIEELNDREIAYHFITQPDFIRNFLSLGIHEILNVPKEYDIDALNIIAKQCPTIVLYCNNDKWAPKYHLLELLQLQNSNKVISNSISFEYMDDIRHDFIVYPDMVKKVLGFVLNCVVGGGDDGCDRFHYDFRNEIGTGSGYFIPSRL